jgi:hypothetical protein
MATPKFDFLSIELALRLNDKVATATADGKTIKKADRENYINKAMLTLFNKYWNKPNEMAMIFPELMKTFEGTTSSTGVYQLASPNKDIYFIFETYINGKQTIIKPADMYLAIKNEAFYYQKPTADKPYLVQIADELRFLPESIGVKSFIATGIKQPINPATGGFLIIGGSYDVPFKEHWLTAILDIAELLFRQDAGQNL